MFRRDLPIGRAVAQAVSRLLKSCGIYGEQTGTGVGFLWVLQFPPSLIPPTAPHSSSIIRGWYNRPNSGRRTEWTQPHHTLRKPADPFFRVENGGSRLLRNVGAIHTYKNTQCHTSQDCNFYIFISTHSLQEDSWLKHYLMSAESTSYTPVTDHGGL
jgi:hypothetical protein